MHTGKIFLTYIFNHLHVPVAFATIISVLLQERWEIINKLPNCVSKTTWCCSAYFKCCLWL